MQRSRRIGFWVGGVTFLCAVCGTLYAIQGRYVGTLVWGVLWIIWLGKCYARVGGKAPANAIIAEFGRWGLAVDAVGPGPVRLRYPFERLVPVPRGIFVLPYILRARIKSASRSEGAARHVRLHVQAFFRYPDPDEWYHRYRLDEQKKRVRMRTPGKFLLLRLLFYHVPIVPHAGRAHALGRYFERKVFPALEAPLESHDPEAIAKDLKEQILVQLGTCGIPVECFHFRVVKVAPVGRGEIGRILYQMEGARFIPERRQAPADDLAERLRAVQSRANVSPEIAALLVKNQGVRTSLQELIAYASTLGVRGESAAARRA